VLASLNNPSRQEILMLKRGRPELRSQKRIWQQRVQNLTTSLCAILARKAKSSSLIRDV
jgi:hypothetical protein